MTDPSTQPSQPRWTQGRAAPRPHPARNPRRWLLWAVPVIALLGGVGIGVAAGPSPTSSDEYQALEEDLASARSELAAADADAAAALEEADVAAAAVDEAEASASAAVDAADQRQAELDQRQAELEAREADVAAREQAPPALGPSTSGRPAPPPGSSSVPTPAPGSGLTAGQQNALGKARDYLAYTAFSRSGLIDQLEYEGFTTADATWAVDNLTVDWNEQAAEKAGDYLSSSSFSRAGLIGQLEYEGFTRAQAEYGASAHGL